MSVLLGFELPGEATLLARLVADRRAYQEALEDADAAWRVDVLDVSLLENLLSRFLKDQIKSIPDLG